MIQDADPGAQIEFPLTCHFKVIAEDLDHLHFVIETVLLQLGVQVPLTRGNASSGGKYVTYNFTVEVESRERMNKIDNELRLIEGVKTVL